MHQHSLVRRTKLKLSKSLKPKPPLFLGLHKSLQTFQHIFLLPWEPPQKNWQTMELSDLLIFGEEEKTNHDTNRNDLNSIFKENSFPLLEKTFSFFPLNFFLNSVFYRTYSILFNTY